MSTCLGVAKAKYLPSKVILNVLFVNSYVTIHYYLFVLICVPYCTFTLLNALYCVYFC